jgi:hypothetical protein
MPAVTCALCGQRKARRACPGIGRQICAICCGTKRLTEIPCPADCVYLAAAREHPPAAVVRQQQQDLALMVHVMRDLNERQAQLFVRANTLILRYQPPELQPLIDEDVAAAVVSVAATYETASRGVIYEHRATSAAAERLASALKPLLAAANQSGGTAFERDVAVVFNKIGEAVTAVRPMDAPNRRAYLDLLGRMLRVNPQEAPPTAADAPRLIVP